MLPKPDEHLLRHVVRIRVPTQHATALGQDQREDPAVAVFERGAVEGGHDRRNREQGRTRAENPARVDPRAHVFSSGEFFWPDWEARFVLWCMATTKLWRGALGGVLVASCVVGCGGNVRSGGLEVNAGGGADNGLPPASAGGGAGAAQPRADAGAAGAPAQSTSTIPPPPDPCAPLHIEYSGSGNQCEDCPLIDCPCNGKQYLCSPIDGCVKSLDCAALCKGDAEQGLYCSYLACKVDGDCEHGQCVVYPSATVGRCQIDSECVDVSDCNPGSHCVAVEEDGTRRCVQAGSSCNDDADCPLGSCALPPDSFVGTCSSHTVQEHCYDNADCNAGLRCILNSCSDGSYGTSCMTSSDCSSGRCKFGACNDGRKGDACSDDTECQSRICLSGTFCSDGALDQVCAENADCVSGICAQNLDVSICADGKSGSKCAKAADCSSGVCDLTPDQDPRHAFGACR
jgi:hypothetical protein